MLISLEGKLISESRGGLVWYVRTPPVYLCPWKVAIPIVIIVPVFRFIQKQNKTKQNSECGV